MMCLNFKHFPRRVAKFDEYIHKMRHAMLYMVLVLRCFKSVSTDIVITRPFCSNSYSNDANLIFRY